MNKCIVLTFAFMVTFRNSSGNCIRKLTIEGLSDYDSGITAFKYAYYNFITLRNYYDELFESATVGYEEHMLLSPMAWCYLLHGNDQLILGGYKNSLFNVTKELSSREALNHSYRYLNMTQEYYQYLYDAYKERLFTKMLRNPVEFCMNLNATHLPSNYPGFFMYYTTSNEKMYVQNQEEQKNAGEESSQQLHVVVDNDGHDIDLNLPPKMTS